ncbi:hypothetical protein AAA799E16_01710 [Marine Group I thaumarchaeote SCGC AAA799-E16]|uniref:Uncharacterized protein n=4 Tax=Marine Group I TaxID=905826 RepID=A0A081RMU5_9ARCH|nr:hypothetical protein AAA799N04_01010 [Marine Group I thaumarchaeote SCGC AAA799-N04]KER05634.1 hypothetical protein AAA799E16_01710 [Marine Group I thaumarchaeote SCGC AAA799-E16]KFM15571.1 hypothetical protein AAA799D11_01176 [Marine Group I thaumarchaeote SCGC AAA799-D11]KFM16771.1 hypothetical protein SCCGRSA3_02088 [Marine Group I thaumarchaeote SCGC RSA3]
MRTDSCRKCGTGLEIKQTCSVCKKPIKFECRECKRESDEQIHSVCRLVDMNYRPQISEAV